METIDGLGSMNQTSPGRALETYFHYTNHEAWIYTHIVLMLLVWTIMLPATIILVRTHSKHRIRVQVLLHVTNGVGVFAGVVYARKTPDLYKSNSHHPLGWIATLWGIMWAFGSLTDRCSDRFKSQARSVGQISQWLKDSTETLTEGMRSDQELWKDSEPSEADSGLPESEEHLLPSRQNDSFSYEERPIYKRQGEHSVPHSIHTGRAFCDRVLNFAGTRTARAIQISYVILEKSVLPLGFTAIMTGVVVWIGLFKGRDIFSGLAHFIKGGIFFWYGLLTFARWIGAFTEFGWAWNQRPLRPQAVGWKKRVPSAEFTESFMIWLYGASNVFLEHLNATEWTHVDMEHVAITILFFGGGLLGMAIEWLRNTRLANDDQDTATTYRQSEQKRKPPLNPMPALIIMLLGIIMSSHHQSSHLSTMLHAQWGALFCAAAFARATTYVLLYITAPSHLPARPPSEIVASFCLSTGGLMMMLSARDSVKAIEATSVDAVSVLAVIAGLAGVILGWEAIVLGVLNRARI